MLRRRPGQQAGQQQAARARACAQHAVLLLFRALLLWEGAFWRKFNLLGRCTCAIRTPGVPIELQLQIYHRSCASQHSLPRVGGTAVRIELTTPHYATPTYALSARKFMTFKLMDSPDTTTRVRVVAAYSALLPHKALLQYSPTTGHPREPCTSLLLEELVQLALLAVRLLGSLALVGGVGCSCVR